MTREAGLPTPAQNAARKRNWKIRCLRALWAQCGHLTGPRLSVARAQIDAELVELGAEPETARRGYL